MFIMREEIESKRRNEKYRRNKRRIKWNNRDKGKEKEKGEMYFDTIYWLKKIDINLNNTK